MYAGIQSGILADHSFLGEKLGEVQFNYWYPEEAAVISDEIRNYIEKK